MKYIIWPDDTKAKIIEDRLVEELPDIMEYTEKVRMGHFNDLFQSVKDKLGLEDNRDEIIVLSNINPFIRFFEEGRHDVLLKLTKERLPLSGDGYVFDSKIYVPRFPYILPNRILPDKGMSISLLGNESPLLRESKISSYNLLAKCYNEQSIHNINDALQSRLSMPDFNFSNMFVWMDRGIGSDLVANSISYQCGLGSLIQLVDFIEERNIEEILGLIKEDPHKMNRLALLDEILTNKETKTQCFISLFYRDVTQQNIDAQHFDRVLRKLEISSKVISELLGKEILDVKMRWIEIAQGINIVHEHYLSLGQMSKKLMTPEEIKTKLKPSNAVKMARFLDMPELLDKAPSKVKSKMLVDKLGL